MGKGDKKTKRGKIIMGSYGKNRPHKKKEKEVNSTKVEEENASNNKKG